MLIDGRWRVTMADVDGAGIIYYASPLRWAEVLLSEWLDRLGHPISAMLAAGEATPVVGVKVRYRSLLSLDDRCRLQLATHRIGTTSFATRCEVFGPSEMRPAVDLAVTHAYVEYAHPCSGGRASAEKRPLPRWLRDGLAAGLTPNDKGGDR